MESFFRYISYVDFYSNGERVKNVGFLRWKLNNNIHQIEIQLKDVSCMQGRYEIKEKNTKKVIGDILIDKGIGTFRKEFPHMITSGEEYVDILNDRLYINDVEGFLIFLDYNEYLSVEVQLNRSSRDTKAASENILIEGIEEKYVEPAYIKEVNNEKTISSNDNTQYPLIIKEKEGENTEQIIVKKEPVTDKKIKIIEHIHEDKWQQLCKKYPTVHPFPNDRVFLSFKPEDFIVLQQGYQKLVHNSFLLHGFYNYGHMILGKLSDEKETPIYVGVPGVYYEQEKRAAQMFGFVGFESVEHPVQAGSYGYYMIEVEI